MPVYLLVHFHERLIQLFSLSTTAPTEWEGDGSDDKPDGWEKDGWDGDGNKPEGWEPDGHKDPTLSPTMSPTFFPTITPTFIEHVEWGADGWVSSTTFYFSSLSHDIRPNYS